MAESGGSGNQTPTPARATNPWDVVVAEERAWLNAHQTFVEDAYDDFTGNQSQTRPTVQGKDSNSPDGLAWDVQPDVDDQYHAIAGTGTPKMVPDPNWKASGPNKDTVAQAQKIYDAHSKAYQDAVQGQVKWVKDTAAAPGGTPLTQSQIDALDSKAATAASQAETAASNSAAAASKASVAAAEATLALDPTNQALVAALNQAKKEDQDAQTRYHTAQAAEQEQTNAQHAKYDDTLAALGIATTTLANAGAVIKNRTDTANATVAEVNATYADDLAKLNLEMQRDNITYQEFQNRKADLDNQKAQKLLDLGEPEVDVATKQQALDKATQGDPAYAMKQLRAAVDAGTKTADQAIGDYRDIRTGKTLGQRVDSASQNSQNLMSSLLQAGMVVGKGYKGMSPAIGQALGGLGLPSPDLSSDPSTFPAFAKNAQIVTDPNEYLAGMQLPDWLGGGSAQGYAQAMQAGGAPTTLLAQDYERMIDAQRAQAAPQAPQAPGTPPVQAAAPVAPPGAAPVVEVPQGGPPDAPAPPQGAPPAINITVNAPASGGQTQAVPPKPVLAPAPARYSPPPHDPGPPVPNAPAVPWKDPRQQYAPKPVPGPASPGGVPPSYHWAGGGVAVLPPYARAFRMPAMAGR